MKLNDKLFNYIAGALILLVALAVYSNSFNVPLQFDDIYHIQQKKQIQDLDNFSKIKAWTNVGSRPVPMLTFAVNYRYGEDKVLGYHILNLVIHIITGWIVYMLTMQLLSLKGIKTKDWLIANKQYFSLLVALLFVAHPMQTQAVTYIIQRITSLATLFYLLAVLTYIKGRVSHIEEGFGKKAIQFYILTGISFILALLSKQTAATLPVVLVITEAFFIRDSKGQLQKKFFYILSGVVALVIIIGFASVGLPRETKDVSRSVYMITSLKVLVKYIQMMIVPINQSLDHDIKASETLFGLKELVSLAILLGIAYLGYFMYKRDRLISFGISWFFITLSIESSIIPIRDFMFEHRMYLPSYGFILAALAGLSYLPGKLELGRNKVPAMVILAIALIIGAGLTAHARNKVWQTNLSLWSDAVKKGPGKARPYMWQGIAYTNLKDYKSALECYNKSIEIKSDFAMAYYNRGNIYKELEDNKAAIDDYTKAIELDKKYALAYFNRGVVKAKVGNKKAAIEDYNQAIKLNSKNAQAYYNRGNAYRTTKKYPEAIEDYNQALKLNPRYSLAAFNRGLAKAAMDQHQEAIADFDLAISMDPRNYLFYNGKGVSQNALQLYQEAIINYTTCISLNPKFGQAYYNRAYSKYYGLKDQQGACEDWQMAVQYKYGQSERMLAEFCQPAGQVKK